MECVYPPVRQNSRLVFLPGRNHVELPQNWLVFLLFPKWKTASSFYYDGAVQSHLNLPMLSMFHWRSIVLPCEELDKKRASEKVGATHVCCLLGAHCTLELLECTSMIKLKGQVLPLGFDICSPLSAVGEPEGAVASNHTLTSWDWFKLVGGFRFQFSQVKSPKIRAFYGLAKASQDDLVYHICSMKWCIPNGCKWTKYIQM